VRVLGWIYAAVFCALSGVALYLDLWLNSATPAWLIVVLGVAAVAAMVGAARFAAWNDPRTSSRRLTRPPWWWVLLLSVVIASGPFLGRLVATIPLLTIVFMLAMAALFGLAVYLIRRDWPRKRSQTSGDESPEGDTARAR
jgi:Flp pilus assembly protein CpaB